LTNFSLKNWSKWRYKKFYFAAVGGKRLITQPYEKILVGGASRQMISWRHCTLPYNHQTKSPLPAKATGFLFDGINAVILC